jgi:hypothetical protein
LGRRLLGDGRQRRDRFVDRSLAAGGWRSSHPEESEWWLAAESAGSLKRLVELLSKGNDALARKLRPRQGA